MLFMNDYQDRMTRTYKPDREPNHALGIAGEIGEIGEVLQLFEPIERFIHAVKSGSSIAEAVKKSAYHKKPVDRIKLLSELGDLLWYVSAEAEDNGFTLQEVAEYNIRKLEARYPDGFVPGGGIRGSDGSKQS